MPWNHRLENLIQEWKTTFGNLLSGYFLTGELPEQKRRLTQKKRTPSWLLASELLPCAGNIPDRKASFSQVVDAKPQNQTKWLGGGLKSNLSSPGVCHGHRNSLSLSVSHFNNNDAIYVTRIFWELSKENMGRGPHTLDCLALRKRSIYLSMEEKV